MNRIFFKKRAETLIELMIALAILSIVLITSLRIVAGARLTLDSAKSRSEAVSLAREWLEMTRYLRDYNWMTYWSVRRICWNFAADNQKLATPDWVIDLLDDQCEEVFGSVWYANHTLNWWYIPYHNINSTGSWKFYLSASWWSIDVSWAKKDEWSIYSDLSNFRLCQNWEWWLIMPCNNPWIWTSSIWLKFFRKVQIEYIDFKWDSIDFLDVNNKKWANHMKVTSSVIWPEWNKIQSVDLVTIFSDYYWRSKRGD